MADLAYYPTDDARFSLGVSSLDGYNSLQLGGEYLLEQFDAPVSLTAETRIGQDGAWRLTGGIRLYIGPERKSLIRRHREDDPSDRSAALAIAANGKATGTQAAAPTSGTASSGDTSQAGDDDQAGDGGDGADQGCATIPALCDNMLPPAEIVDP
jgi:hypothetical protein